MSETSKVNTVIETDALVRKNKIFAAIDEGLNTLTRLTYREELGSRKEVGHLLQLLKREGRIKYKGDKWVILKKDQPLPTIPPGEIKNIPPEIPIKSFNVSGSKYLRPILLTEDGRIDVYAVLEAFDVRSPPLQHGIKKLLCAGIRGKGNKLQDLKEARDAIERAIQIEQQRTDIKQAIKDAQPPAFCGPDE